MKPMHTYGSFAPLFEYTHIRIPGEHLLAMNILLHNTFFDAKNVGEFPTVLHNTLTNYYAFVNIYKKIFNAFYSKNITLILRLIYTKCLGSLCSRISAVVAEICSCGTHRSYFFSYIYIINCTVF